MYVCARDKQNMNVLTGKQFNGAFGGLEGDNMYMDVFTAARKWPAELVQLKC